MSSFIWKLFTVSGVRPVSVYRITPAALPLELIGPEHACNRADCVFQKLCCAIPNALGIVY